MDILHSECVDILQVVPAYLIDTELSAIRDRSPEANRNVESLAVPSPYANSS